MLHKMVYQIKIWDQNVFKCAQASSPSHLDQVQDQQ